MNMVWTHFASISVLTLPWTLPLEFKPVTVACNLSYYSIPSFFFLLCFFPVSFLCDAFSLMFSCHLIIAWDASSLFCFQKCVLQTKYCVILKGPSWLPPCCFSACCVSHLASPVSQQVCLRSSCLFDITKVFLISLRQSFRTIEDYSCFVVCTETDGSCSGKQL